MYIVKDRKSGLYCERFGFRRKYWAKYIEDAKIFQTFAGVKMRFGIGPNRKTMPQDLEAVEVRLVECG